MVWAANSKSSNSKSSNPESSNSESSPNHSLWLWVPDLRFACPGRQWRLWLGQLFTLHGYSITACSGPAACLRKLALVEPIIRASGMVQRMKIITSM